MKRRSISTGEGGKGEAGGGKEWLPVAAYGWKHARQSEWPFVII